MTRVWTLFFTIIIIFSYNGASTAKECTSQGKFPNDHENSCTGYTMCLIAGAGRFAQLNLTCPNGFIFNHDLRQCTNGTSYQCQPEFNCTHIGNFPNPLNNLCNSYIACVEGFSDIITARSINCAEGFTYNPDVNFCVDKATFQCKEQDSYIEEHIAESMENSSCPCSFIPATICIYLLIVTYFIVPTVN